MYPNQDPNQTQYSIDYLNQIAPQPQKQNMGNKKFFMLVGGGLVFAIIVGILVLSSGGGAGPTDKMHMLVLRMELLREVADDNQQYLKSGELRGTNSNMMILLTEAGQSIVEPLEINDVDIKKVPKDVKAEEETRSEELAVKLEDARLNAVLDRTYSREMGYQLDTIAALMSDIYSRTKSKSLREYLVSTDKDLQAIKKQFYDFNAANG